MKQEEITKYIKMKISILFPRGAYMIDYPFKLRLIHGFATQDMISSTLTTPGPTKVANEYIYTLYMS
eukprot:SAG11_NODE_5697_length_1484_cov_1.190614_2_plen_67_part_00